MFSTISSIIAIIFGLICIELSIFLTEDRWDAFKAMLWCISERLHGRKV